MKFFTGTSLVAEKIDHPFLCQKEYLSQVEVRPENVMHRSALKAPGNLTDMEKVHKRRIERVEAVCEKYKKHRREYSPSGNAFLFDVKNHFSWCRIAKVIINLGMSQSFYCTLNLQTIPYIS